MSDGAQALRAGSTRINTDNTFGENLESLVCEDKNRPACRYASEADTLDEYLGSFWKQLGDFVPFYTPNRVLYCQDIKPVLDQLCFPVSMQTQKKLRESMEGSPDAKTPAKLPSVTDIYVDLTAPASELTPDQIVERNKQQSILDKHIQAKARKIYEQMVRIRQLREQNSPDIETARMDFVNGLKFVCVEDSWMAIDQRKDKCDRTVKTYEENKGWMKKAGAGAAAIGLAVWAAIKRFFSSGQTSQTIDEAAEKLKKSKKEGKGFFRRWLGAWDFLVEKVTGKAEESEAIPADGTAKPDPPAPNQAGGGGETATTPAPHPAQPAYQGPVDKMRAAADLTIIAGDAEIALRKFSEVAQSRLPRARDKETAKKVGADTDQIIAEFASAQDRAVRLSPLLRSDTTIDFLRQLGQLFEQAFATTAIDAAEIMTQLLTKPDAEITSGLSKLDEKLKELEAFKSDLVTLYQLVRSSLGSILYTIQNPDPNFVPNYKDLRIYLERMLAKKDEIIAVLRSQTTLANAPSQFKREHRIKISSLSSAATIIQWLNAPLAEQYGVKFETNISGDAIIPEKHRRLFLAMMYKPYRNSITHSRQLKKGESFVRLGSQIEGTTLTITIEDNGQGMSAAQMAEITAEGTAEEVLERALAERATPERFEAPTEAPPEGGFGRISAVCRGNGWRVETISRAGEGTTIKFIIDISGWERVEPKKSGSGGGSPGGASGPAPEASPGLAGTTPPPTIHVSPTASASEASSQMLSFPQAATFEEAARVYIETLRAHGVELTPLAETALVSHYITAMERSGGLLFAAPRTGAQFPADRLPAAILLQMGPAATNAGFGTVALPVTGTQSFMKLP